MHFDGEGGSRLPGADESPRPGPDSVLPATFAGTTATERLFRRSDAAWFVLLSTVQVAAIGLFSSRWFRDPGGAVEAVMLALLSIPIVVGLVTWELRWITLPAMRRPLPRPTRPGMRVGVVTTFVPSDESFPMLERTLRALVAMRYPHDTWVLDEGDEDRVRRLCEELGVRHFSRSGRPEYQTDGGTFEQRSKHGNYNAWLAEVGYDAYEVVVAFDPDHVARPDFLEQTIGYFDDPSVGYVQAAQIYYNQPASFIARGAAEETYAYYSSIQMTAYAMGYPIVTGCHNAHRVSALREVGGFAPHEADDLLITILYRVAGWRGVYVPEPLAFGLAPVDWPSYLGQQRRWTRSVLDVKLRVFPRLARRLPLVERMVSLVHGLYPLQVLGGVLGVAVLMAMLVSGRAPSAVEVATLPSLGLMCAAVLACDLFRQRFLLDREGESGLHWRARLLRIAKWPYVVLAVVDAFLRRGGPYVITRKIAAQTSVRGAAVPHLAVAAAVGVAWAVGAVRGTVPDPAVHVAAALVVAVSAGIGASAARRFPAPYDAALADMRLGRAPAGGVAAGPPPA